MQDVDDQQRACVTVAVFDANQSQQEAKTRLARMTVAETYENQAHYDITFLMFVWIAFLPTIIVPWIYASWVLSKPTKERLRGYLRLSSRRNTGTRSDQSLEEHGSTPPGKASKQALPLATPMPSVGPTTAPADAAAAHRRSASGRSGRAAILSVDRLHLPADATATTSMMHDADSKSPAGNSARTVETTISRQSSVGRPRRQLPPPLRIEENNFNRTPSVQSGRTPSSAAHNASLRSTASRVSSSAPIYSRRYSRSQPPQHGDDDDDVSSLVGNSSDVTSSTYCVLPEAAAQYADDPLSMGAAPHRHTATYRRRSSAHTQASTHLSTHSHATSGSSSGGSRRRGSGGTGGGDGPDDRDATDELLGTGCAEDDDDVSEIFSSVSQPSARKPVGILKATPSIASISESEYSSRKGSFSTLSRDLEIIDQLERERSMDIQEMMQREKSYEQYLVRQNSKLKFSTNFDEYFESAAVREAAAAAAEAAAAAAAAGEGSQPPSHQGGGAQLPLQPLSVAAVAQLPPPTSRGAGSLSPRTRARSPMHRRSSQLSGPPASGGYGPELGLGERQVGPVALAAVPFGPRRSIELERRFHRTYSTSASTRSSTRSRDRITFHDQV
uniref:Uncharacterized protein n=1 Tax=Anopheles atroparvus TaxID=41427 RepID=A0A182IW66_ANOAO